MVTIVFNVIISKRPRIHSVLSNQRADKYIFNIVIFILHWKLYVQIGYIISYLYRLKSDSWRCFETVALKQIVTEHYYFKYFNVY